jgi:PST family polysaccharide transporter
VFVYHAAMEFPARLWRKLLPHLSIFLSFNVIQATQFILPLLALPWLARVLGPESYGLCLYMGIISGVVTPFMDWGFILGATRDVAVNRGRDEAQGDILADVLSAKALLAVCCLLACLLLAPVMSYALEYPGAYALAVLAGIARGVNPTWFFQGLGRSIQRMAVWDVASSALVLLLVVVCVRAPGDWPLYSFLIALCKGSCYLFLIARQLRQYGHVSFSPRRGLRALTRHRILFVGSLSAHVSARFTQLVLGYFLLPAQMGLLVTADKIARAAVSLNNPAMQTIFPEISALNHAGRAGGIPLMRLALLYTATIMIAGAAVLWYIAPWLVDAVLGGSYAEMTPVLRTLCFFIPLQACNIVLAWQILVPLGKERTQVRVQAAVAVFSLPAAVLLGHFWGLAGGACLPVLLEGGIMLGFIPLVLRCRPEIFCGRKRTADPPPL